MNDLLFFILIFFGVSFIASLMNRKSDEEHGTALRPNGLPKCPPHKWTYKKLHPDDEYERMICDQCKRTPLSD